MATKNEIPRQLYLKTPCNHIFCAECVATLLLNNSLSCPLCRASIKVFADFHYNGDLTDPLPTISREISEEESDTESDNDISQEEYDQTLYQFLVEYWASTIGFEQIA